MLIDSIQKLRERLVFLKLYFAERSEQERYITRFYCRNVAGSFAIADAKAALLQRRLSILGSEVCSMLVEWDNLELRNKYEKEVPELISKISLSKDFADVEKSLVGPLKGVDFKPNNGLSFWLQIYKEGIHYYCGAIPQHPQCEDPLVPVQDIQYAIDKIKEVDVKDPESLNALVDLLGRRDLFDFKAAAATQFFRGRLN